MKCIVCGNSISEQDDVCKQCGFKRPERFFFSEKQYEAWYEKKVVPYQKEWQENQKRERKQQYLRKIKQDTAFCGTFGLDFYAFVKQDGTVAFEGSNQAMRQSVKEWKNIIALAAGDFHLLGLNKDGRVLATGKNNLNQCNVENWKEIVQVAACTDYSAALDKNGRVYICGTNEFGVEKAKKWSSVKKIALGNNHILALMGDNTVKFEGSNEDNQGEEVKNWTNIVDIAAGEYHSLALQKDGTVFSSGLNLDGECNVEDWKNIMQIQAAFNISMGVDVAGNIWSTNNIKINKKTIIIIIGKTERDFAIVTEEDAKIIIYIYRKKEVSKMKF